MQLLLNRLLYVQAVVGMIQEGIRSEHTILANVGESVLFECHTLPTLLHSATWRRGNLTIFIEAALNPNLKQLNKFNISGDQKNGEYFLRINNIGTEDFGSYRCETQTGKGAVQRKITLALRPGTQYTISTDYTGTTEISRKLTKAISTDYTGTTEISRKVTKDIGTATRTTRTKGSSIFGLRLNWTFVFSGLVGGFFVIVIALSVLCSLCAYRKFKSENFVAPNELVEQRRFQEYRRSTIENSSYNYIDDRTLMGYVEPDHRLGQSLPTPLNVYESVSQYLEVFEETVDLRIHPYRSLTIPDNCEKPRLYMNCHAPGVTFSDTIYHQRPNSLDIDRNHNGKIDIRQGKRANSWPNAFQDLV